MEHNITSSAYPLRTCVIRALWIVREQNELRWLPVHQSWRLNERHPRQNPRYTSTFPRPGCESLTDTVDRVQTFLARLLRLLVLRT